MRQIHLIKLYRGPCYLPPVQKDRTLSPAVEPQDVESWWTNGKEDFKKMVLEKRTTNENIEAVAVIIAQLPDVTIFSHEFNEELGKHTNPQVVPNEDIKEIVPLKETNKEAIIGSMILAHWLDASHNNTPVTTKIVKDWQGIMNITQLGFLVDKNEERTYMGGSHSIELDSYKYIGAVPTMNIMSMKTLSA